MDKTNDVLQEIIAHYRSQGMPLDQLMLPALLREAQEADGGVLTRQTLAEIASGLNLKETILLALIRRIPSLRLDDAPHRLEICGTCGKSRVLIEYIQKNHDPKACGFTLHVTGCMKNCRQGPSIRWDGMLYSHADGKLLDDLISSS